MSSNDSDAETEHRRRAIQHYARARAYGAILTIVRKEQAKRNHMKAEGYDVN